MTASVVHSEDVLPSARISSGETACFRFGGHQTFPLRIAWIPKAVAHIVDGIDVLTDVDEGILRLGLGKNMVEALRCWIDSYQIAKHTGGQWELSEVGALIFGRDGIDPYLEDASTSWVLHWLISTNRRAPFWAWECLFNRWPAVDFHATSVLDAFKRQADQNPKPASPVTLKQHWEVFLHTYYPTRAENGEDGLDSALSVLRLIRPYGERQNAAGKWEPLYSFDTSMKIGMSQNLFAFFLHDWWNNSFPEEQTVPFREIVNGNLSPGRVLKMQESEVAQRLTEMAKHSPSVFEITESMNLRQFRRLHKASGLDDLRVAYRKPRFL